MFHLFQQSAIRPRPQLFTKLCKVVLGVQFHNLATNHHLPVGADENVFDSLYYENNIGNLDRLILFYLQHLNRHLQQEMLVFVLLGLHHPKAR
jgi:hypothetical protein